MKDYQKRLVEEYKQLKERLVQLDNFVKEQEGFGVEESKVGHPTIKILDACCGSRLFWFDKAEPHTTYMDRREEQFEIHGKKINVKPDVVGDFRDMPFEDNSFNLVVFDPPHLKWAGPNSIMKAQYGLLDKVTWAEDLAKGFDECMRVLKVGGTLVFKWSDAQVNVKEILELVPHQPLFGQQRGTTHWMTFMKF